MQDADYVAKLAPELEQGFRDSHPVAQVKVATKLAEALWREDIGDARRRFRGRVHAFERVVLEPIEQDPLSMLDHYGMRSELASAVTGLALGYARRKAIDERLRGTGAAHALDAVAGLGPDLAGVRLERLATEGHNLHPCGRTRLGWDVRDMLHHDLETPATEVTFLKVRWPAIVGDDLSDLAGASLPQGAGLLPVHAWQAEHLRAAHPALFADGTLQPVDETVPALPTGALRTVLLGSGRYLKLSLDIQVTSTRRTISIAATRNGPVLSELIGRLVADDPEGERILLMPEVAGAASTIGTGREVSAIVREGLDGRLTPGEVAVPGSALPAVDPLTGRTILAGLVDRYGAGPLAFVADYARLLLPVVLRLATRYGIALEAHLQNCVPTFVAGRPHRMALRDFAGLRIMAGSAPPLWPGSVIATDDRTVMLSKVAYTAFQAHLGELVIRLTESHGLGEDEAWRSIRQIVAEILEGHSDVEFYTAPAMPHKALTRMRLSGPGDLYVPVRNPLHV